MSDKKDGRFQEGSPADKPGSAEIAVSAFLPDPIGRRIALTQLVASASHAQSVAPNAWGATLYPTRFRLNVGRVEVLVVGSGFIRMNCVGRLGSPPFVGPHFEQTDYQSVPDPKCAFVGPIEAFSEVGAGLQHPHREFIELAGKKQSGEPVSGSPHTRSHSDELLIYARSYLAIRPFSGPDEVPAETPLWEGAVRQITVNAYERDPEARRQCIEAHGTTCCICGFNFGAVYGPEAEGYIQAHHLRPLSESGGRHVVNPIEDMRPVCPNCHAVLHLGGKCRSVEEVRQMLAGHSSDARPD